MKVVLGSSGGSKNTHSALSKPFSSYSQVAIVAHKKGFPWSGGEKMFPPTRSIVAMIDTGYTLSVLWPIVSAGWPSGDPYSDNYQSLNRDHDMELV